MQEKNQINPASSVGSFSVNYTDTFYTSQASSWLPLRKTRLTEWIIDTKASDHNTPHMELLRKVK